MKCECYQRCEETIEYCDVFVAYFMFSHQDRSRWQEENLSLIGLTLSADLRFNLRQSHHKRFYDISYLLG